MATNGNPEAYYEGIFTYVYPNYGFIKDVKSVDGEGVLGKDVLLTATEATKCIAQGVHHILKRYEGARVRFHIRQSAEHPDKSPLAVNVMVVESACPYPF